MPKRKTIDEFRKEIFELGNGEYTLLSDKYVNNKVKIKLKHELCGFVYDVKPNYFISGNRCPFCAGKVRKDTNYFKNELLNLVGDEYNLVDEYVNTHTKIKFKHNCGNIFKMSPHNFLSGQRCPKCQHRSYVKTTDEFKEELFELVGNEYTLEDEYINGRTKVNFRHAKCGKLWNTTPSEILNGYRCLHCYGNKLLSQEEFENKVYEQRGDEYSVIGKYVNFSTKVLMKHNKCKYIWEVQPSSFLGKVSGCPKCNQSKGETKIERYLLSNQINHILQMKYEDLLGINNVPLSYDFFLPDYNILIEYQGQQHEYAIDWFGGEEKFKRQQEIDRMKRDYAKEHNIDLLEIWYWNFNNIEKILESRLLKQSA